MSRSAALQPTGRRADSAVRSILDRVDQLPTISVVAQKVGELVSDPKADAASIARILRTDQSLTAKVLKLANSPYYAIPGGVTDVTRAISFLGFNTLYQLVLSASVLSVLGGEKSAPSFDPKELWKHALGTAAMAEIIARDVGFAEADACFTCGLLHDIGKVALLHTAPEEFIDAVREAREHGRSVGEVTVERGLPAHQTVGLRMAERWRFPMPIRVAISHHELQSPKKRAALAHHLGAFVDITALSNQLIRRFGFGDPGDSFRPDLHPELLERLNLTSTRVEGLRDHLMRAVDRSKVLLELVE